MHHFADRRTLPLTFGLLVLALWETVGRLGLVNPVFLPAPSAVVTRLLADLRGPNLVPATLTTLGEALTGATLAAAVAIPLGYLVAKSAVAGRIIEPYAAASQAIPAIALAPLLLLWIGPGFLPIVVLCAIMVFFPIMLNTALGISQIPRDIVNAARLDGAGTGTLLWHVELPLATAHILTGLRNGLTLSVTGAVVGEFTMGGRGLGMLLTAQSHAVDTTGMFATLVLLAGTAILLYVIIGALERQVETRNDMGTQGTARGTARPGAGSVLRWRTDLHHRNALDRATLGPAADDGGGGDPGRADRRADLHPEHPVRPVLRRG
ncbi:MAG: ABC transporter permease [Actinobacteria bacterium]|nr:ABC transporter permease [Actinomycetota bacterium]